jgi:hypothetical protein
MAQIALRLNLSSWTCPLGGPWTILAMLRRRSRPRASPTQFRQGDDALLPAPLAGRALTAG